MFSIIIPLYNKENTIIDTLKSVLSQTYQNFELIVVNDGSLDSSLIKVRAFITETQCQKIILIDKNNEGVSIARNTGLQVAKNEWICFLDADDQWTDDFLDNMYKIIKKYPEAIMYSLQHTTQVNGNEWRRNRSYYKDDFMGYVEDFFKASLIGSIANSSKTCVAKKKLVEIGGFPEGVKSGEDLYVWIELALLGKVAFYNRVCTKINVQVDSSRIGRSESVPYPLIFFSERKEKKRLTIWAMLYLRKIFLAHFIESVNHKQYSNAKKRLNSVEKLFPITVFFMRIILFFTQIMR